MCYNSGYSARKRYFMYSFSNMLRRIMAIIVVLIPLCDVYSAAWTPVEPDIKQKLSILQSGIVDHLIPMDLLANVNMRRVPYLAQYAMRPSSGESLLWVLERINDQYIIKQWKDKQFDKIISSKAKGNYERKVPEDLAMLIHSIWVNALLESRYPRVYFSGLDGCGYYFSAFVKGYGQLNGAVWSPEKEAYPPYQLVKAGNVVSEFLVEQYDEEFLRKNLVDVKKVLFHYWADQACRITSYPGFRSEVGK